MLRNSCFSRMRPIFQCQAATQVFDHLADGDCLLVHLNHGTVAGAIENLLEGFDQIDHVGGDFRLRAFGVHEFLDRRIRPDRVFDLLLLHQHLRGRLELFVLDQPIDQLCARIFLLF